jgi:hypothetical protein
MSDENQRRDFLKSAAMAALGGVAASAMPASAQPMRGPGANRVLTIYAKPGVTVNELSEALRIGLGPTGCRFCGLMGVDVRLEAVDPPENIGPAEQRLEAHSQHIAGVVLSGGG